MNKTLVISLAIVCVAACAGITLLMAGNIPMAPMVKKSIKERLDEYGPAARARLVPHFERAKVAYPPARLTVVALKEERLLSLYAFDKDDKSVKIHTYPILGASGGMGPKLKEGDRQVPEGFYAIESLNPNSRFHLSLRVNYPNSFDKEMARADGRDLMKLGGDIMIHGNSVSVGCLAMGDPASEELFVLAADTGLSNISLVIAPYDLAARGVPAQETFNVPWQGALYEQIKGRLAKLK